MSLICRERTAAPIESGCWTWAWSPSPAQPLRTTASFGCQFSPRVGERLQSGWTGHSLSNHPQAAMGRKPPAGPARRSSATSLKVVVRLLAGVELSFFHPLPHFRISRARVPRAGRSRSHRATNLPKAYPLNPTGPSSMRRTRTLPGPMWKSSTCCCSTRSDGVARFRCLR
jgi:hypothetical protein